MPPVARLVGNPFKVAEDCTVELSLTAEEELKKGDAVEVQFPNSWLLVSGPSFTRAVQTSDPEGQHYVGASADGAKFAVAVSERNLFFPERGRSRHGRLFTAKVIEGAVPAGGEVRLVYANTPAPYIAEREEVYVRVKGQAPRSTPEVITKADSAVALRVIAPSGVEPGTEFEVLIVSLDRFENRSETRYEKGKLELVGGGVVAEGLSFTGACRATVSLPEEGVYRFKFGETISNAVRVAEGASGPHWGDIHIHTGISCDGQGNDPYGYARDVSGLDFAGACDHTEDLGEEGFRCTLDRARAAYRPGKFVTILADERNPDHWTGHHNAYFRDEETFLRCQLRPGCFPRNSPEESRESVAKIEAEPENCMLLPHHTGMGWRTLPPPGKIGCAVDLDAVEDERGMRPALEVYGHHGQSELYDPHNILAYEFNRMRNPEQRSNTSVQGPYYAQDYWLAGRRMGVIGSSDEHSGQGGRRHGGIAGVFSEELTREGIFDGIRARQCYATTGERILMEFTVDGVEMGQDEKRAKGAKLPIRLSVWGTESLIRIDVLRHRFGVDDGFRLIHSVSPREGGKETGGVASVSVPEMVLEYQVELEEELTAPVVYYARVLQMPLEWPGMAWTSPVWIDPE